MKSRVLLISAIVAATAGLSVTAQADHDAQAQAAALLSSSYVVAPASTQAKSVQSVQGDAQAQAAALLSSSNVTSPASARVESVQADRGDAQEQAATLLSGTRSTIQETARTSATTERQLGDHPAVVAARTLRKVDPNTFLVAHPARLQLLAASPIATDDTQPTDVHARLGR